MEAVAFVIATVYGLFVFYIIIGLGLFRDVSEPALVIGTWLAVVSGGCWYLSAIIPPIWPTRLLLAGVLSAAAAISAAGAAAFLVPDDQLASVRNAFGLG
jgi:hypothetical protein